MAKSIHVDGYKPANPIPAASRVRNVIATGGIEGYDPKTFVRPKDVREQARLAFRNLRDRIEAGGGSVEDIVKMEIFMKGPEARDAINVEWLEMFPDPNSRPARHVIKYDGLQGDAVLSLLALAILE